MIVNGKEVTLGELPSTGVHTLLAHFELDPQTVAIERNGAIVPRSDWDALHLSDSDRIELIRFVGGG